MDGNSEEVEVFLDPDNEVFFGPITVREREIRKSLPRRTLHPSEMAEIKEKGMTYLEWETQGENFEQKYLHDGYDSEREGDGSLNDTWEIQEKMLMLAEKLEKGEDIPELGIYHILSKNDKEEKENSRERDNTNIMVEKLTPIGKYFPKLRDNSMNYLIAQTEISETDAKTAVNDSTPAVLASSRLISETPSKEILRYSQLTPLKTSNSRKINKKQNSALSVFKYRPIDAPSPVGIYIRSIPEPILIENVRSTSKRQINAELIRNFDQDGSIEQKNMTKTIGEKGDVTPVLPAVLHMAAPSIHTDGLSKPQTSTPVWYRGKIGKLLDRNVTPTVFKHKGRVQVSKYSINSTYSPQKVQPPKSNGSGC